MTGLTRGKVAREAGVNIETLRYYERRGVIPEPPRLDSGYRLYPEDTIRRIRFIRRAQHLGFSLEDIRTLLSLRADSETTCDDVRKQAEQKISEIEEKIRLLQQVKQTLVHLVRGCQTGIPLGECPILKEFEHDDIETA